MREIRGDIVVAEWCEKIQNVISLGWIIAGLDFLCFVAYGISLLLNLPILKDISLTISAGLFTGLVIYGLTNHRSKKERDLINISSYSREAVDNYLSFYISLSRHIKTIRSTNENVDLELINSLVDEKYDNFVTCVYQLRTVNYKRLPELKTIDTLCRTTFFSDPMAGLIKKISQSQYADDCQEYLDKIDDETRYLNTVLLDAGNKAEKRLRKLRRSII